MAYRHSFSLIGTLAAMCIIIIAPLSMAVHAVADFARACLKVDHGISWHALRSLPVIAFRKIADLMPVYRESYDTHGLSLDLRRRC